MSHIACSRTAPLFLECLAALVAKWFRIHSECGRSGF